MHAAHRKVHSNYLKMLTSIFSELPKVEYAKTLLGILNPDQSKVDSDNNRLATTQLENFEQSVIFIPQRICNCNIKEKESTRLIRAVTIMLKGLLDKNNLY